MSIVYLNSNIDKIHTFSHLNSRKCSDMVVEIVRSLEKVVEFTFWTSVARQSEVNGREGSGRSVIRRKRYIPKRIKPIMYIYLNIVCTITQTKESKLYYKSSK